MEVNSPGTVSAALGDAISENEALRLRAMVRLRIAGI